MRSLEALRSCARSAMATALLVATGCALPSLRPSTSTVPDSSGASDRPSAALLRKQLADDARLDAVGHALLRAAAPGCVERTTRAGFRMTNVAAFSHRWQPYARQLGYTDTVVVLSVAPGSGAERAGLLAGDRLIGLGNVPLPVGAGGIEAVGARIRATDERAPTIPVTVLRERRSLTFTLPLEKSCAVSVMSWRQDAPDAWSDGHTIAVTTGMLKFAASDADLAVLLAHEIAHADLQRRAQRSSWESLVHGAATATQTLIGIASDDRFTRMRAARPDEPWETDTERAADARTFQILRAAGAPPVGVHAFWRRVLLPDPSSFPYASTHPMSMERILRLEALERGTVPQA